MTVAALEAYLTHGADFGLIHADLVCENVLVDGPDLRFIDFDDCGFGFGFRVFDLATTILKNLDEAEVLEAALLDDYQQIRPLTKADLDMLLAQHPSQAQIDGVLRTARAISHNLGFSGKIPA